MRDIVLMVQAGPAGRLSVKDQTRQVNRMISPERLPARVREAARMTERVYFHGAVLGDKLAFGDRYIGDPGFD
jgi:hypothetical protein